MLWDEESKPEYTVPDNVVDLFYKINCKQIPTTHAFELAEALYAALPWLKDEPSVGIHQIHGATSGNGWERPPDGELIQAMGCDAGPSISGGDWMWQESDGEWQTFRERSTDNINWNIRASMTD